MESGVWRSFEAPTRDGRWGAISGRCAKRWRWLGSDSDGRERLRWGAATKRGGLHAMQSRIGVNCARRTDRRGDARVAGRKTYAWPFGCYA